jgi:guanidinopropionase
MKVADLGDLAVNPIDLPRSLDAISAGVRDIVAAGSLPLGVGGDHLATLPILRSAAASRPVALIQFDAHSDTNDSYFNGQRFTHGTPFRRAIEENLLLPERMVQIGIRGSLYDPDEHNWALERGIRIFYMEEVNRRGVEDVMREAREIVGTSPTYITFDVDCVDPSMAPGTGTPEIGGFTTREAQQMIRNLHGVDIIGADVVEVSPPFDVGGTTALLAATALFELCSVIALRRRMFPAQR